MFFSLVQNRIPRVITDNSVNPELEKRWQRYLRRCRFGKYLMKIGVVVIAISIVLGVIPVAVAAFSGTVDVSTPWSGYMMVGVIIGAFLILVGIIAKIAPNMMEGDALWIMKLDPFGKGR